MVTNGQFCIREKGDCKKRRMMKEEDMEDIDGKENKGTVKEVEEIKVEE